jgi:hypothetical protein
MCQTDGLRQLIIDKSLERSHFCDLRYKRKQEQLDVVLHGFNVNTHAGCAIGC